MGSFTIAAFDPGVPVTGALVSQSGLLVDIAEGERVATEFAKGGKWQNNAILIASLLREWQKRRSTPIVVVCELVNPMPTDGVVSACKFVGSMYLIQGVAAGMGIRYKAVPPAKWKADMALKGPKDQLKEVSRHRALETWPAKAQMFARKMDHNRAEAALLGLWGALNHDNW